MALHVMQATASSLRATPIRAAPSAHLVTLNRSSSGVGRPFCAWSTFSQVGKAGEAGEKLDRVPLHCPVACRKVKVPHPSVPVLPGHPHGVHHCIGWQEAHPTLRPERERLPPHLGIRRFAGTWLACVGACEGCMHK